MTNIAILYQNSLIFDILMEIPSYVTEQMAIVILLHILTEKK